MDATDPFEPIAAEDSDFIQLGKPKFDSGQSFMQEKRETGRWLPISETLNVDSEKQLKVSQDDLEKVTGDGPPRATLVRVTEEADL